jgi:oligopeptide transport system substrate-binding protein
MHGDSCWKTPILFLLHFFWDPIKNAIEYRNKDINDFSQVGIRAIEDQVLEIELNEPADHFLSILCHQSLVAIHPEQLELNLTPETQIIGAGPYVLESQTDELITMPQNPHYWDLGNLDIDQIEVVFSEDAENITSRFNSGEIQWIYSGVDFTTLEVPNSVQINPQFGTSYYFFSQRKAPFDDERIRTALTLLLPLDEIRSTDVYFFPTDRLVPGIPGYPDVEGIQEQNIEEALSILDQAGYPKGQGLPEIVLKILDNEESYRIGTLMAEAWTEHLEVPIEIKDFNFREYQLELQKDDYVIGSVSWVGDYADPLTFLQLWTSDSTLNEAYNRNQEYDDIIAQSYYSQGQERFALLGQAEELLLQTASLIPVSHSSALNIIDLESVAGWYTNPLDIHPFKNIYFLTRRAPSNVASLPE